MVERKKKGTTKTTKRTSKKSPVRKTHTSARRVSAPRAKKGQSPIALKRSEKNPIITPSEHFWESRGTFNPSALLHDGLVHIIYRAVGGNDISMVGYAQSKDGVSIHKKFPSPMFYHHQAADESVPFSVPYSSGGGTNGGCEDARLTKIGDRVYMVFTAFDGWSSIRIALTWISLNDFLNQHWKWKKPVFISPPNEVHKNWVLFPEKIKGKYAILHRITPKLGVAYVESLDELDGTKFLESVPKGKATKRRAWDNWLRGAGPSPILTPEGWLVLYHAMDNRDPNRYKLGALLLDAKNPEKIIARASEPILEPDEWYENQGFKAGVIYACGAIIKDGTLFVYYGGADTVSCVAAADVKKFLKELKATGTPKLARKR
ncbi:MAG: hypothetical protein AAB458_01685 [Patescibacteria group bacterium]